MNIEIKNISEIDYQNFVNLKKPISFLHNYQWGEVEKKLGKEVFRWGIFLNKHLEGVVQIIGHQAKRGNFLTLSHGPVINDHQQEKVLDIILAIINKIYQDQLNKKYIFLRANFLIENDDQLLNKLLKNKFKLAPRWFVSENFWIKELNHKTEEELLQEMSEHHRKEILSSLNKPYLIIEKTDKKETIEIFWELYQNLSKEKGFIPYSYDLIKTEFEIFSQNNQAFWYLGKIENKYYSCALIIFANDIAHYHHSASFKKIKEPLNYKLQWQIILDAQKLGCQFYNFWGITDKGPEHPWYGLTVFKKGFGGREIKFLPTLDYVFNFKYYLIYSYEKIKDKIKDKKNKN